MFALMLCVSSSATTHANEVFAPPHADELHEQVLLWLQQRDLDQSPVPDAIEPLWEFDSEPTAAELFDALLRTYYLADDDVRALVDQCRGLEYSPGLLEAQIPGQDALEPLLTNNVRYFLARHLTLLTAYDEASRIFDEIELRHTVDPAGCLFHKAVCEHHLLQKEAGLATLTKLLDQTEDVPLRYRNLGELMQTDLDAVEEKSLGEVARQMRDVERRLTLGHTGHRVQRVEDKIIATLDELIEKLEQQQSSSSSASGSSQSQPNDPASESYVGGVSGPGLTDKKDIGHKDKWGDLPPKAREAAKNMLERQFPAHYRQAVEQYLKKLAERPAPTP